MKKLLLILLLLPLYTNAQTWVPVGNHDFSASGASFTPIALDANDTPYVAFGDANKYLRATVMKYNGSSWVVVGSAGFSDSETNYMSLAIDRAGTPYVAFEEYHQSFSGDGPIAVMKYNGSSWEVVGHLGFSAGEADWTSIAIGKNDTPYVAYQDNTIGGVTVQKYNESDWVTVGIAGCSVYEANHPSLAINNSGTPYVAYIDINGYANVIKYNGSTWVNVGDAGLSAGVTNCFSIAIDHNDTPYVVCADEVYGGKATVMKYQDTGWIAVGNRGFSAGGVNWTKIAIDGYGMPYITYVDIAEGDKATVMKFNGTSWVYTGKASISPGETQCTSIAINSYGAPYVAYGDGVNNWKATVMKLSVPPITGVDSACVGAKYALNDTANGGMWSSNDPTVAVVDQNSGVITGFATGTAIVSYTISDISTTTIITVNDCSIPNNIDELFIFPNPNNGEFTVSLYTATTSDAELIVTNTLGQKVYSCETKTNTETELKLIVPPGIYFITAVVGTDRRCAKLLVL